MTKPTPNPPEPAGSSVPDIPPHETIVWERKGRSRLGGSLNCDVAIQRARHAGRRVKPLDGDLRSRTLSRLYPCISEDGKPVQDGASSPNSEELPVVKSWLLNEFDEMAVDRVSRVIDLGGGDRVMQELVRDMSLVSYCAAVNVKYVAMYMLGPDLEDFRHVVELARFAEAEVGHMLLVLNEGVIRQGQSVDGVFEPILNHPDMKALLRDGARAVYLRRLTCMEQVAASGMGFYEIAEGRPNASGVRPRATLQHMTKIWLQQIEEQHIKMGTVSWLP